MEGSLPRFDNLPARLFVVMGVAGCGKSSVGQAIAEAVGGQYLEGDAYHPPANVKKMSAGTPLTDIDRWPWLEKIGREMAALDGVTIAGCSALKRVYREKLRDAAGEPILFVFLDGSFSLIESRMASREGHFMPTSLLKSQFETLERPLEDEFSISVSIDQPIVGIVDEFAEMIREI